MTVEFYELKWTYHGEPKNEKFTDPKDLYEKFSKLKKNHGHVKNLIAYEVSSRVIEKG